jgi:TolB-like protein/DNA-binding winged helix-turn-helix (wHTH) protein
MPPAGPSEGTLRFDDYELNLRSGELLKSGHKIRLQEQPLRILAILIQNPGQVVTREVLRQQLWSAGTFVDFDHSLNTAIKKLRQALNDEAEKPRYIETLPKRGYRFVGAAVEPLLAPRQATPPTVNANESTVAPQTAVESGTASTEVRVRATRWRIVGPLVTLVAAAGIGTFFLLHHAPRFESIAVLPFTNAVGDPNTDYLSDGITESLIANLTHVPELKVKSRNSVFRYKGKDVDAKKVGNDLDVSALVTGRVVQRGDNIEVSAELTDVRDNTEIWGQHYSSKSADIISLQKEIAGDLAEKLRSKLSSSEKQQVTKQGTQNPEAYDLYLRGLYHWNKQSFPDSIAALSYFNQAIAKDPGYVLAYSSLADVYADVPSYNGSPNEYYPKSNAAARKALELEPTLAHPHAVLGSSEIEYDWDFAGGEAEYKKAFELDPNDANAHAWYAYDIGLIGGREQEAIAEVNRAHQLDPLSPISGEVAGFVHISARQYDEAIVLCKKLASENPAFATAHACLARAYWGKRMYPQVIEEWKAYGQLSGDRNDSEFASALEQGFRSAGWKRALAKGIEIRQAQRKTGYSSASRIAELYADLGDKDGAFRWLNTAYQERDYWMVGLKTSFLFDPIRSDPRFAELVRKVGLPQ